MASTTFQRDSTHTNLVPQRWSRDDYKFGFEANPLKNYMGTSENSIIQVNKDFLKAQGDKITFALRALLTGSGQTDDGTYEDNEESMTFYDDSIQIHERGNSVLLSGNMTEQAAYAKLRPKGRAALREWVGRVQARDIIDALSGLQSKSFAGQVTGGNALDASSNQIETVNRVTLVGGKSATATRYFAGGNSSSGTFERVANNAAIDSSTNNLFGTLVIEYVKRMATKTIDSSGNAVSPIRPIYVDGEPHYVFFIDRLQFKALKAETRWKESQQYAGLRGKKNPIFNGAAGVFDGVVIKVSDLLHRRTGAGGTTPAEYFDSTADPCASGITVARGLFVGAQAAGLAWGKMPIWEEGFKDWQKTKWGCHTNMIYGTKKTVFNSIPFGCIVVDTAVATD